MTMKYVRKILALVLALSLPLCAAFAETAGTAEVVQNANPVLATVNGEPIYKSECDEMISLYAQQDTQMNYAQAVAQLKFNRVLELVMKEEGYLEFTDEETAAMRDEIQAMWDGYVEQYTSYYLSEDTEEARAELRKQAEDNLYAAGYSVDSMLENQKLSAGYERLEKALVPAESVTEEMIQQYYSQIVEQHKSLVGDSVYMRELYSMYYGDIFYMPAGYRNVTHILIKVDDALLQAYQEAKTAYTGLQEKFIAQQAAAAEEPAEAVTEEAPAEEPVEAAAEEAPAEEPAETAAEETPAEEPAETAAEEAPAEEPAEAAAEETPAEEVPAEEPVTDEQLEAARLAMEEAAAAVLASKQAELDDIETRLAAGESFETLIAQYNEDTGLNPAVGYEVHPESVIWDPVFRDAAFSEEMTQPGDHSKPVIGSYGIHILYYLSDAEEGAVPMSAEVRGQIADTLRSQLINEAAYNIYQEKLPELEITQDDEAIAALDGTAAGGGVSIDFEADQPEEQAEEPSEEQAEEQPEEQPAQ